jgi:ATP-dependent exoDNAse (exonuclease V) beta subunit
MNVINKINDPDSGLVEDVRSLLLHLSGNQQRCVDLISSMLGKRDQWMRHVSQSDSILDKDKMASVLDGLIIAQEDRIDKAFSGDKYLIAELLEFASENLPADHFMAAGSNEEGFWERAANLFLTADNKGRKTVTKAIGFPAGAVGKERKESWKGLAETLSPEHLKLLAKSRSIPSTLDGNQWGLLENLFRILWQAAIELKVIFIEEGQVDFTEISQRALAVLRYDGDAERNIAFKMFNWYRHILVDEVQDNNRTQYQIIEALVQEWDPSLGNTLFMVGDPKQSVYRFREADVGLFMQSKEHGIGQIKFEELNLTSNFRSSDGIVDWNNQTYSEAFPLESDISMGAVPYSESTSVKKGKLDNPVTVMPLLEKDPEKEAELVIEAVKEALEVTPDGSIAILVRARTHLNEIASALFDSKISYQAIEIEKLSTRQVILDALSITKAITHAFDNTAWMALLRLPCIGLTLADITVLCENIGSDAVLERLMDQTRTELLSPEGKFKVQRLLEVMYWAREKLGTVSTRQVTEGVWLQLNAPAGYSDRDIRDVQMFFGLLDEYNFNTVIDFNQLMRRLDRLYAKPKFNESTKVTLMTLHKSKGLEFDTVIMPGLGRSSRASESSLVMWHEFTSYNSSEAELLVAPIKSIESDPTYEYLMEMESEKDAYERMRLMYVGTTRPMQKLVLIGHIEQDKRGESISRDSIKKPPRNSMLSVIWDSVEYDFYKLAKESEKVDKEEDEAVEEPHRYRRVSNAYIPNLLPDLN